MKNTIVLIFFLISISSCIQTNSKNSKLDSNSNAGNILTEREISIDNVLKLSSKSTLYKIEKEENLNYNDVIRNQIRISIPSGLEKSDVRKVIKTVIYETYKKYKSDGISVLVFEKGDNINTSYSVAMGEFTPTGEWGEITKGISLEKHQLNIVYNDTYFEPKNETVRVGSIVKLNTKKKWNRSKQKFVPASRTPLSNSATAWEDSNIIAYVPNNITSKIIDTHKEKLVGGYNLIRYKVKVKYNAGNYTGWVHEDEVKITK